MIPKFLRDVRFADLTWAGAGPFSTKVFSDFGAEVIKIESTARHDPVRVGGPFKDCVPGMNRSGYFASRNTGKKSISINIKSRGGRALVEELIRRSDVLSNNFGPGAMDRLGLGYEKVRGIKPDIIYLAMPMYGEDGPFAAALGLGMTISAVAGLTGLTGYAGGPPVGPGTHFPDHAANPYHAAFAVLAALRFRRLTGRGMKIDLSQVESTLNCVGLPFVEYATTGIEPERVGNRSRHHAPHNIFRCLGEDRWCAVAVLSERQWRALCRAIGRPDLARDPALDAATGRLARVSEVEGAVAAWTAGREAEDVMQTLQAAGVPAGVVADARVLMDEDPQLRHRGYWQRIDHPEMGMTRFTAPPFLLDGERVELQRPPLFGEHTDDVLEHVLGYTEAHIQSLRDEGVLA
ncbi:MAG: CaiB/BaiF CoA transferase family protein [Acetobacteraceae bacterium]